MNKKQIAVISPSKFPGRAGDTANYSEMINQLACEGFEILLICPKVPDSDSGTLELSKDVKIIRVPCTPPRLDQIKNGFKFEHYLKLLLFLIVESITVFRILRQKKIKCVLVRHSILTMQLPFIFRILGVRVVADGELISYTLKGQVHQKILQLIRSYEQRVVKFYSYFKVPTINQAKNMQEFLIPSEKILIMPICIRIDKIPKFSIDEIPEHTFGYFGALEKWQGVDVLLKSFQILLEKLPNATLYVIGEGSLKTELQNFVEKNNISNVVFATASRNTLWQEYFKKFRVSVIPMPSQVNSMDSNLPIKLIESLAAGKAIIATNIPSMREISENSIILVPSGDHKSLADAMVSLSMNSSEIKRYAANALVTSTNYDIKHNIKKLISVLVDGT